LEMVLFFGLKAGEQFCTNARPESTVHFKMCISYPVWTPTLSALGSWMKMGMK
jgi:hypothetical protein